MEADKKSKAHSSKKKSSPRKRLNKIISITQQKGGTGKTTTALAFGAGLARRGYKVLLIDLDPQGNLSYTMAADSSKPGIMEVLHRQISAADAIQDTPYGKVISTGLNLATAELSLTQTGKEYRLKEALSDLRQDYTIILDTPPALGTLTINALTASDDIIIPCLADIYSLQATSQIAETITTVKQYCNPQLSLAGLLVTRYNARQVLSRDTVSLLEEAAAALHTRVFKTHIRENVSIREAQASQRDIFSYAVKSNAAIDYNQAIEEYLHE